MTSAAIVTVEISRLSGGKLVAVDENNFRHVVEPFASRVNVSAMRNASDGLAEGVRFHANPKYVGVAVAKIPTGECVLFLDYPKDPNFIGCTASFQPVLANAAQLHAIGADVRRGKVPHTGMNSKPGFSERLPGD